MFKKLIIIFDKKNEPFIRRKYAFDLQIMREEMQLQGVSVVWNFAEKECENRQQGSVPEAALTTETLADTLYLVDNPGDLDVLRLWGFYAIALKHEKNMDVEFKNTRYIIEGLDGLDYNYLKQVYQRLAGLPWDILETERLRVRESTLEDVKDFYRIYEEPSITNYMENLHEDPDEECAYIKDYIRYMYGLYGYGMWTVILKGTEEVIGRAGISIREGYEVPELGFVIETIHQGKGYASEVCRAILEYAYIELQMESVQALVCDANEGSKRVLEKLGFSYCKDVTEEGKKYQLWMKSLSESL